MADKSDEREFKEQQNDSDRILAILASVTGCFVFSKLPFGLTRKEKATMTGKRLVARLSVDAGGHVVRLQLPEGLNSEIRKKIKDSIAFWLFLPRIKEGNYIASEANLPIRW